MELSTQFKGDITELLVSAYLLNLGYVVSKPLTQNTKYDLIVDIDHRLIRLQVKTSRLNDSTIKESIKFNCRSTTNNVRECKQRRYSSNDVDYFATYWKGLVYLVPVDQCSTEKVLWLEKPTYKNSAYAKDYIAEEVLKHV